MHSYYALSQMVHDIVRLVQETSQQDMRRFLLDGPIALDSIDVEFLPKNLPRVSPRSTIPLERQAPSIAATTNSQYHNVPLEVHTYSSFNIIISCLFCVNHRVYVSRWKETHRSE